MGSVTTDQPDGPDSPDDDPRHRDGSDSREVPASRAQQRAAQRGRIAGLLDSGTVLTRRVMRVNTVEVPVRRRAGVAGKLAELVRVLLAVAFVEARRPDRDTTMRSPRITARVGLMLGVCVLICFATGLLSHWIQHPPSWFYFPSDPPWLYRLSQGLHVITGTAAIPLLLIKLQIVYPRLFARPVVGTPLRALERLSIAVLVSSMIFQLFTGLMNTAQFYPWKFFFTTTHYAMSYVIVAALMVHIAVKLPIIQAAFTSPIDSTDAIDNDPVPRDQTDGADGVRAADDVAAGSAR